MPEVATCTACLCKGEREMHSAAWIVTPSVDYMIDTHIGL